MRKEAFNDYAETMPAKPPTIELQTFERHLEMARHMRLERR
jgi:hypothetical protein